MNKYSERSEEMLLSCDYRLEMIFRRVLPMMDHVVLCGHRDAFNQDKAFSEGKTKLNFPNSKHNSKKSLAVDVAPYPVVWEDKDRFIFLAGIAMGIAQMLGVKIRWGGNWSCSHQLEKQAFNDLSHFEIIEQED